jgi:hypothetical protein
VLDDLLSLAWSSVTAWSIDMGGIAIAVIGKQQGLYLESATLCRQVQVILCFSGRKD